VCSAHVANVIRRLKRIAVLRSLPALYPHFGDDRQPSQPGFQKLIEEKVITIDQDGSEKGVKHFIIYNPPIINEDLGIRRSLLQESASFRGSPHLQPSICGFRQDSQEHRAGAQLLRQQAAGSPTGSAQANENFIRGYRSGYLPNQRREIEQGLRSGEIRIAVATNALELGIDIGNLEAVILAGYPGTIASTWQQAGRAGRGSAPALSVLVVSASPLDQYLARNPDYFFSRSPEQALINPDNLLISWVTYDVRFRAALPERREFWQPGSRKAKDLLDYFKRRFSPERRPLLLDVRRLSRPGDLAAQCLQDAVVCRRAGGQPARGWHRG
jgi:DEAD/DEAH box helicase domain-containing protein